MKYNQSRLCTNILKVYKQADEFEHELGFWWYKLAHEFAQDTADKFETGLGVVSGVIAALSPGVTWDVNKKDTINAFRYVKNEILTPVYSTYRPNWGKALLIMNGDNPENTLGGLKTLNFYRNILNPYGTDITIDRHAIKIARGMTKPGALKVTPNQYNKIADAYLEVSNKLGIRPNQLQAITWSTYKRIHSR